MLLINHAFKERQVELVKKLERVKRIVDLREGQELILPSHGANLDGHVARRCLQPLLEVWFELKAVRAGVGEKEDDVNAVAGSRSRWIDALVVLAFHKAGRGGKDSAGTRSDGSKTEKHLTTVHS